MKRNTFDVFSNLSLNCKQWTKDLKAKKLFPTLFEYLILNY